MRLCITYAIGFMPMAIPNKGVIRLSISDDYLSDFVFTISATRLIMPVTSMGKMNLVDGL